jgi:hypothetical protein
VFSHVVVTTVDDAADHGGKKKQQPRRLEKDRVDDNALKSPANQRAAGMP